MKGKRAPVLRRKKRTKAKRAPPSKETVFGIILSICLLLAIIGIIFIIRYTHEAPAPYSTLGFTNPDDLPNLVRVGNEYNFTYQVKSLEHEKNAYNIVTTYELYRLYDVTEGLHACLSPYRRKVYVGWTNWTNVSHQTQERQTPIQDLVMLPSKENPINWSDEFTISFTTGKGIGDGTFTIYYEDHETNETQYQIDIRTSDGMVFFNGEEQTNITMAPQNDKVSLNYKGGKLSFSFNNELIFTEDIELKPGQIGFETRDTFISLNQMIVRHHDEIDVPYKENRWDYHFDNEAFLNVQGALKRTVTRTVTLGRQYEFFEPAAEPTQERPADVPSFPFNLLNNDLPEQNDTPREIDYSDYADAKHLTDNETYSMRANNVTDVLKKSAQEVERTSFWLRATNINDSKMPWNETRINITFEHPEEEAMYTLLLGEHDAVQIANKSIALVTIRDGEATIRQTPRTNGKETLGILITKDKILVEGLEARLETPLYEAKVSAYQENTYNLLTGVRVTKDIPACHEEEQYDFCHVNLIPSVARRARPPTPSPQSYASVITERSLQNETGPAEGIATQQASFDGFAALITNQSDYSIETKVIYLDGKGLLDIGLQQGSTNVFTARFNVLEKTITYNSTRKDLVIHLNKSRNYTDWLPIKAAIKDDTRLTISVNNTEAFMSIIAPTGINQTRHFTRVMNDTYFETSHILLEKDSRRTNVPLLEDPCKLRVVHAEVLREETVVLNPEMNKTFTDEFSIDEFFDYGKVSVDLYGSSGTNNTALHTHYWMVRE